VKPLERERRNTGRNLGPASWHGFRMGAVLWQPPSHRCRQLLCSVTLPLCLPLSLPRRRFLTALFQLGSRCPCLIGAGLSGCQCVGAGLNTFSRAPMAATPFSIPPAWNRWPSARSLQVVFHDLINSDETLSLVISGCE